MQHFLDHVSAVLIGGAVMLLVISVWTRHQSAKVAATMAYQARSQVEAVREVISGDMERLGVDVPTGDDAILGLSWTGDTRAFEFQGRVDAPPTSPPDRIRYLATSVPCSAGDGTCWRLRRQVHDGSSFQTAGFDIEASTVSFALLPSGPVADATMAEVQLRLPGDPHFEAPPVTIDRRYRLLNQTIRLNGTNDG